MSDSGQLGLPPAGPLASLVVIGTGLLGTSIALAAVAAGVEVVLDDTDAAALDGAQHITGSRRWQDGMPVADHAVICVPPSAVAGAVQRAQRLQMAYTFSDVASVKSRPLLEAETLGVDMSSFRGRTPHGRPGECRALERPRRSLPQPAVAAGHHGRYLGPGAGRGGGPRRGLRGAARAVDVGRPRRGGRRGLPPAPAGGERPGGEPGRRRAGLLRAGRHRACATPRDWPDHRPACGPTSASRTQLRWLPGSDRSSPS